MAKKFITTEEEVIEIKQKTPKIKAVHPFGGTVLIEILNPDEMLGTNLYIKQDAKVGSAPQAYIIELGNALPADSGLKVGDRILLSGKFNPVDNTGPNQDRQWGIVDLHSIRAILEEEQ